MPLILFKYPRCSNYSQKTEDLDQNELLSTQSFFFFFLNVIPPKKCHKCHFYLMNRIVQYT